MLPQNKPACSRLEETLRAGHFAVTAELNPPDSADPNDVYKAAEVLSGVCDGINAVDASGANTHISSVGICALLTRVGYEPVYQVTCRDRNRIAIQGDLLGAAAMGVQNVLCLSGDDVTVGDQPEAKRVFDLDSIQLIRTVRMMRDESVLLSGRKLTTPPCFFIGAAANPFIPPLDWRPQRLAKKIAATAIWSTVASFPQGILPSTNLRNSLSCSRVRVRFVSTNVGAIELTVIPCLAHSTPRVRTNWMIAPLVEQ